MMMMIIIILGSTHYLSTGSINIINLPYITSKFDTIAMFLIVDLWTVFLTEFVSTVLICPYKISHA
jgi:hypothetical protein